MEGIFSKGARRDFDHERSIGGNSKSQSSSHRLRDSVMSMLEKSVPESYKKNDSFVNEDFHDDNQSRSSIMSSVKEVDTRNSSSTVVGEVPLLPEDTYALLATSNLTSASFVFAVFVVLTQVTSWFFLIESFVDIDNTINPFGVPADVEFHVRLVGFLGVVVAVFSQDDIVQSFNSIYNGFQLEPFQRQFGYVKFQFFRWCVSIFLRVAQGSMGLLTVFLIVVRASSVVDMLLSFAAGEFISFIDDVAFGLMKYGYSGVNAKADAFKVCDAVFVPNKRYVCGRRLDRFPRSFVIFVLMCGLLSVWAWVTHLQLQGHYMCKSVFVQFSDEVRPEVSYFYGFYEMRTGQYKRDGKVTYWEERSDQVNNGRQSLFRFCPKNKNWVLTLENKENPSQECDNVFAETDSVEKDALFDFIVASESSWSATDSVWDRSLPISRAFISCAGKDDSPASLDKFPDSCKTVTLDERYGDFKGTREWQTTFTMLLNEDEPVLVYEKAVFVADIKDGITDLILFLGYRWGLTSTALLADLKDTSEKGIKDYLQNEFHSFTSNYTIAFFSSAIEIESVTDLPNPISSSWNMASTKIKGSFQSPSSHSSDAVFICKYCSERSECFSQGICVNGTCDCVNGGSGTLCQISPQGDGYCDKYFNTPEYNFDGGDCCSKTCISSETFECGKDRTKEVEIGYDLCVPMVSESTCDGCWAKDGKEVFGDTNSALSGSSVSLTSEGRVLAVGDTGIDTVRIFDKHGADWLLRGSLITGIAGSMFGSAVFVSGPMSATENPRRHIPVTVLAVGIGYARIYDWIDETGTWVSVTPSNINVGSPNTVPKATLHDSGNIFGILGTNGIRVWTRSHLAPFGEDTWSSKDMSGSFENFSLSEDGKYVFGIVKDSSTVRRIDSLTRAEVNIDLTNQGIVIESTSNGSLFAVLVKYREEAEIWVYRMSQNGLYGTSFYKDKSIRGIPLPAGKTPSLALTDDGLTVTISFLDLNIIRDSNTVRTFTWSDPIWKEVEQKLVGASFSLLRDGSALAVGEKGNDESGPDRGKITFYTRNELMCASNEGKYLFTLSLDAHPTETFWQFQTEGAGQLIKDGPYKYDEISITQALCIPLDKCMNLVIFDTRGNGMQEPGLISIATNGTIVKTSSNEDFGFEKKISIPGIDSCTFTDRPWVEMELHQRCRDEPCEWTEMGSSIFGVNANDGSGNAISLSDDGKILAIGSKTSRSADGNMIDAGMVRVLELDESNGSWKQMGQRLYGTKEKDTLGHAVSLSSNGKRLIVGVPKYDKSLNETDVGMIQTFEYSESTWIKMGSDIIGEAADNTFGQSVTISGDGNVICAGAPGNSNNGNSAGHVRCYRYNEAEKRWIQRGQDLEGEEIRDYFGIAVALSHNGLIMAAGADFNDGTDIQAGHVRVFEYSNTLNEWNQLGTDIDGESADDLSGSSISMSMDGKTIAIGATLNKGNGEKSGHVRVYIFNGNDWKQKGQDIDGESAGDNSGGSISLSNNGAILAIGARFNNGSARQSGHVRIYQFVPRTSMWHQIGSDIDGDFSEDLFGSSVALSANGLLVAASSPSYGDSRGENIGQVKILEIKNIVKSGTSETPKLECDEDSSAFRLQIIADSFPKDLSWGLFNSNGDRLRFEDFYVSNEIFVAGQNITRQACLKKSETVSFLIVDRNGDGVCCDWGEGSFEVYLDEQKLGDNTGFQSVQTLCLGSDSSQDISFSLDITLDEHPDHTWWLLYDSSSGTDLMRSIAPYTEPYASVRQAICVDKNKCLTFVMGDHAVEDKGFDGLNGNGGYVVTYGGVDVKPKTGNFGADDIVRVGSTCFAPFGKYLVQIITQSHLDASKAHWVLTLNDSDEVLLERGNYTKSFYGEYDETFVESNACLNFRLIDSSDLSYSIYLNGTLVKHGHRESEAIDVVRFGSCSQCQEDKDLFQVVILERDAANQREAPWYMGDTNSNKFISGGRYTEKRHTHYHEICAPKDECLLFNIFGQIGVFYQVMWAGQVLSFKEPSTSVNVKFGTCTNCLTDQGELRIFLNMGEKVNRLGWQVIESDTGNSIRSVSVGNYKSSDQFQQYVTDDCVASAKCYNISFTDSCSGSCLKYEIFWDQTMVSNGTTFDQSPMVQVGNCSYI